MTWQNSRERESSQETVDKQLRARVELMFDEFAQYTKTDTDETDGYSTTYLALNEASQGHRIVIQKVNEGVSRSGYYLQDIIIREYEYCGAGKDCMAYVDDYNFNQHGDDRWYNRRIKFSYSSITAADKNTGPTGDIVYNAVAGPEEIQKLMDKLSSATVLDPCDYYKPIVTPAA